MEQPTTHSVSSSSGRSASTLSGGLHFINFVHGSPPQPSSAVHAYGTKSGIKNSIVSLTSHADSKTSHT